MRDEFLVFGSPLIGEEEIAEVVDSLRTGWIGTGPKRVSGEVPEGADRPTAPSRADIKLL